MKRLEELNRIVSASIRRKLANKDLNLVAHELRLSKESLMKSCDAPIKTPMNLLAKIFTHLEMLEDSEIQKMQMFRL